MGDRRRNWQGSGRRERQRNVHNRHELLRRSLELWRRSPCIGWRLWRTHSGNWRTLTVGTPTQLSRHLLSANGQLSYPVFFPLKTCPQQNALLSVPIKVLSVTIQSFFKCPLHVVLPSQDLSQLTPEISHQPPELCYLVLQSSDVAVHLLLLERGSLTYPDTPRDQGLTWAEFITI